MASLEQIKNLVKSEEYDFLRNDPRLGSNIILLGVGGSHAYGTNIEGSDLDLRGVALNTRQEILGTHKFQSVVDDKTDTTIFSVNKAIDMLTDCNPNIIELLGLRPEHYLQISAVGQELIDNRKLFLSKRAVNTFGGFANNMLKRLNSTKDAKVPKHQMHTIRLYLMGIDVLTKEEIVTYREDDHDELMSIRLGAYVDSNGNPLDSFYDLVQHYEGKLQAAAESSKLPEVPNYNEIFKLRAGINERVVLGTI